MKLVKPASYLSPFGESQQNPSSNLLGWRSEYAEGNSNYDAISLNCLCPELEYFSKLTYSQLQSVARQVTVQREHIEHIPLRLPVRWNATVPFDRAAARIVRGQRE